MIRTLEQKRAKFCLEFIRKFENDEQRKEKLRTLIQKSPVFILQNGLGQLLAYLLADNAGEKGEHQKASGILYCHLQEWLCGEKGEDNCPCRIYRDGELIKQVIAGNRKDYIRAQEECLALLNWLKKFAETWLK